MAFDDACHVRHADVAEFDVKFIENFVEAVVWGEVLVDETEELLHSGTSNIHIYFLNFSHCLNIVEKRNKHNKKNEIYI